jgi:hypothetical protein
MPVAAKSTPSKARRTTTRKPRATKKATTKSVASVATVTPNLNSEKPAIKKVTETKVNLRPEKPNLSFDDYVADAKVRWQIHQWETKELWNDCKWVYNNAKPIVIKVVNYCKESYERAFNQDSK